MLASGVGTGYRAPADGGVGTLEDLMDRNLLVQTALAGLFAGTVACGGGEPAPAPVEPAPAAEVAPAPAEATPAAAEAAPAADGAAAPTAVAEGAQPAAIPAHECKGKNECKGQGGCKTSA